MSDTDRIGDLHLEAVRETGRYDVLGDVPRRVSGRSVHLGRVLAGESTATVAGHAPVGVDDDLPPGQSGVGARPPDLEHSRRVHEDPHVRRVELGGKQRVDARAASGRA